MEYQQPFFSGISCLGAVIAKYFSPDSKRFAFDRCTMNSAYSSHKVVVDGVNGKEYQFPGVGKVFFSPDSNKVAYVASDNRNGEDVQFVAVNETEKEQYIVDGYGQGISGCY
jgi:hypothetical protein